MCCLLACLRKFASFHTTTKNPTMRLNWQSTIIFCQGIHVECGFKNPLGISSTSSSFSFWPHCQHFNNNIQQLVWHGKNYPHWIVSIDYGKQNIQHWTFICDWKQATNALTIMMTEWWWCSAACQHVFKVKPGAGITSGTSKSQGCIFGLVWF